MKYIPEPFKIKMVEPIAMTSREERANILARAHYNMFGLPAESVYIDLLTDSGTGAMSDAQWAAVMRGDEAYSGGRSYMHLMDVAGSIFGYTATFSRCIKAVLRKSAHAAIGLSTRPARGGEHLLRHHTRPRRPCRWASGRQCLLGGFGFGQSSPVQGQHGCRGPGETHC